jgi:teichuronic acid biosynthesis glycosyltransferase TuaG
MNTPTADVSVIIPFYNRETYIDEAVQSVLAQTLKPLEIIIVNDCSKEASRRFLDRYGDVCRIVDLPKNVGLAGSRNAGIRVARGKFIALLDDDDAWLPRKLEVQYRYMMEHPDCTGSHTAVWTLLQDKPNQLFKKFEPGPLPLSEALTHSQWAVPSTLMIRTDAASAIGNFDRRFRESEDRDFIIRCCAAGYHLEGIEEPLALFRRTGHEHLAGKPWKMWKSHLKICWKHRALYFRAYGPGGPITFFLQSTYHVIGGYLYDARARWETKYLTGIMWRVHILMPAKFQVRRGYKDPVIGTSAATAGSKRSGGGVLTSGAESAEETV